MLFGDVVADAGRYVGTAAPSADFFDAVRVVGSGAGGAKVVVCRHRLSAGDFAVKVISKAAARRKHGDKRVRGERDALLALSGGPGITGLACAWQTPAALYLAMPLREGVPMRLLLQLEGRVSEGVAAFYAAQLLCALDWAHDRGISHRGVEPEALLVDVDQGRVTLLDLSHATQTPRGDLRVYGGEALHRTRCGRDEYWPPEMARREAYGSACDVWAAAVVLYELVAGQTPSHGADNVSAAILERALDFSDHFQNAGLVDLLRSLLHRDAKKRLGVSR
ncbi:kinase-like domain-containing protein, partial [Pelagophyceae sp. CCMP2097]